MYRLSLLIKTGYNYRKKKYFFAKKHESLTRGLHSNVTHAGFLRWEMEIKVEIEKLFIDNRFYFCQHQKLMSSDGDWSISVCSEEYKLEIYFLKK